MAAADGIVIAGAGSIGCYVGGMLAASGLRVGLLARPRLVDEIAAQGLWLTSFDGGDRRVAAREIKVSDDAAILREAAIILVCVKSADTAGMAITVAAHARPDAVVVSLQNGIANTPVLAQRLKQPVLAGMVPFNVVAMGGGHFHRSTSGDIVIAADAAGTAARLSTVGLPFRSRADIVGVQWGKLLVNLNNALNALSNLPLRDQLSQRPWRMLLADQIAEALVVLKAAGITAVSTTPLPPSWTPPILRLPDRLFRTIAGAMIRIDPQARSSMWEDLQRDRKTEIDYLQGEIIALAEHHDLPVPLSRRIVALIREAEARHEGSPALLPEMIRQGEV
ncbi:2-dehydropantoate 2-reductase [Bradyrhizobium sp. U87765 SZCCT0131]|uniref:2-dehydropantoate 2-reductase n=1 Tax=unclassified Bradyrhizobium TaxID=2631580 RepID=UPI001BA72E38|nr:MULTISPECIES: 2-dehydropantoate 2-reductase [unclassified Bradyrhizobium]MBR1217162.1 2-dehydropantoate 2-reductase [Bradyrhizobium sp. U87765 SZCCT0131]MBR1259082.1 2-dehydropantoate 2-reductase [Bradyrhizobium sp. U87765 SZCCT0134]MBR1305223.1 2-dehydropantoate 2-reductase [Bradyrhizobium sp. U87765 SZCCT0110]MBR1321009.1 2-dehydropantoate 2-reductase [Bradyrhizobium sp. U87765 SZCCT0109]MBR1350337.1 2-dehydropantoate 2-reductase [Bradyrhizobium sp. U87765 SZCCT0048]